jgi:hypothetical protein
MKPQSRKKTPKKPRTPKRRKSPYVRRLTFPDAKGKTVELVELFADIDCPCVSIRFDDSTDLTVVIDPALIFSVTFSKWKEGNERVLKYWPAIHS